VSAEAFSLEVDQRIGASPDEVFRYLTVPELYTRWMGTAAQIDARPGGAFRVEVPGGAAAVGEYLIVQPPELLVYTWGWEGNSEVPPGSSTVEITLAADGDGTILTLRHVGLPDAPMQSSHVEGWTRYLGRLALAGSGSDPGSSVRRSGVRTAGLRSLNEKTTASSSTRSVEGTRMRRSTVVKDRIDQLQDFRKQLEGADVDMLREMVKLFAEQLMGADADALCGADYGERSPERTNRRNGYRERPWDTRAGTIALAVPKLREGTYFPEWLLEPRRRAERAFVQVVAECYVRGVSTRRVEGLVAHLGIERISKSRVSKMAKELDEQVEAFRTRPLDGGPYTYVWMDALTQKVREGGRIVPSPAWWQRA